MIEFLIAAAVLGALAAFGRRDPDAIRRENDWRGRMADSGCP